MLTDKFLCAPGLKLQAHERLTDVKLSTLEQRLQRIEDAIERLERRLWLTVYGVVAVILGEAVQGVLAIAP